MSHLPIMEVFGPTIQGEGGMIGRKTMFVRTGGCDFACSWCDSSFTWNGKEKATRMTPEEILRQLKEIGGDNFSAVTISGGNPALIGQPMKDFIGLLKSEGYFVSIETQGTKWQDWFLDCDYITLSPKPPSSGMTFHEGRAKELSSILTNLEYNSPVWHSLKVVVFDDVDIEFAKMLFRTYPEIPHYLQVGNPDVETSNLLLHQNTLTSRLAWLFDKVLSDPELNDVIALPQLHTMVWGNKRRT